MKFIRELFKKDPSLLTEGESYPNLSKHITQS